MYARVNIIFGAEDKVGPGVAHIEKSDRYVVEAAPGNRGLTTLVDRKTGVIVAISYWDDLGHSSEAALTKARAGAAKAAGGALITENFEIAVAGRLAVPDPGATVQMTRMQLDPLRVDAGLAFVRDELLQRLSACSGLCPVRHSADRSRDRQRVVGDDVRQYTGSRQGSAEALLDGLRRDAETAAGATFPGPSRTCWSGDPARRRIDASAGACGTSSCTVPKLSWSPCDLVFGAAQAIRWYSLITPLRTCRRWIGASSGMTVAGSWLGGRCLRPWCGRWLLKCRVYSSRTDAAWRSL